MPKIVIIGIDSMDRELIDTYSDELPTFTKLMRETPEFHMSSVFPPDSDTAWATIFTGLNPAQHGIVLFVDPLEKASIQETDYLDVSHLRGKTFWDIAGDAGNKVCLLYPHAVYPVWPVNGFIISPVPKSDDFDMYPENFSFGFDVKELKVPHTIPDSRAEYDEYLKTFHDIVVSEFDFAEKMLGSYDCDVFLFYSSVLDFIQHIFWNYCDPKDPTYPGDSNPFRNAIKDFYVLHDRLVGELLQKIPDDTVVMILSDHGHAMRPVQLFNINELLRQNGLLFEKEETFRGVRRLNEKMKRAAVDVIQKTDLRKFALNVLRKYPRVKEFYTIPTTIDFQKTVAHCSDMSGLKSYTYGGIIVQKKKLGEAGYEKTRDDIIRLMQSQAIPGSSEKVFEWVKKREDVYLGKYIGKYPDILFSLGHDYGAGWAINVPLFTSTSAHNFFPGTHRQETPVLFIKNLKQDTDIRSRVNLEDITPTILGILKIQKEFNMNGKNILLKS